MIKKFIKISEEVLHKNPWYEYKHDTFEFPGGTQGDYYYLESPGAAMVVPLLPSGRIVLVRQFRYLQQKTGIEFPGGGIKSSQSPRQTAGVELKEETGYDADELISVGEFEPDNGFVKDRMHVFVAKVSQEDPGATNRDPSEEIEVLARFPDEIDDMIQSGDIWDGETLAVWAMVRHRFIK